MNRPWTRVNGPLAKNLSSAKPDLMESWEGTHYSEEVCNALGGFLTPIANGFAMPAYVVEFKGADGSQLRAHLQCAYDGALMTEGAYAIHHYLGRPNEDFYGKIQAITVAFNGLSIDIFGHYAFKTNGIVRYYRHPLFSDTPWISLTHFQTASQHIQKAQDTGYQ
jgi:hypothetical protein